MNIEKKVLDTIVKYKLFGKKERVFVALSGGKDSTSILYILKKLGYNVEGLMIDLHLGEWSKIHLRNMEEFCSSLKIPFHVVDLKKELGQGICFIKAVLKKKKNLTGCTVCGIIKRWILNKHSKKLGASVLVTGHNLDDEVQNVLMNFLKGNIMLGANSAPSTGVKQSGFVQRVKPLFFIPEDEIRKYSLSKKFKINYDKCPCAFETYRTDTRAWLKVLDLSAKQKLKIVNNFQKVAPKLRSRRVAEGFEIKKCSVCGEPATGIVCNACKIFESFRDDS